MSVTLCDRTGIFYSFDHVADRRRHQVFTQESVASQSLELVAYTTLVDVCFTVSIIYPRRLTLWMVLMMVAKCWKVLVMKNITGVMFNLQPQISEIRLELSKTAMMSIHLVNAALENSNCNES